MAAFLETIEIGYGICEDYLQLHEQFPALGVVDDAFIKDIQYLFELKYAQQSRAEAPVILRISKDVSKRATDLIACNMRQFVMLFDATNAPKVSSIGRQIIVVSSDQQPHVSTDGVDGTRGQNNMTSKRVVRTTTAHFKFQ